MTDFDFDLDVDLDPNAPPITSRPPAYPKIQTPAHSHRHPATLQTHHHQDVESRRLTPAHDAEHHQVARRFKMEEDDDG
jgi:hypothetical protein